MEEKKKSRSYAFDFDGVIAQYGGYKGPLESGEPIETVVNAMRMLRSEGHKIIIHSTRGEEMLKTYCEKYDIPFDYINRNPELEGENKGKPIAFVYIDDRTVCYKGQSTEQLVEEIKNFKTYWEK